MFGSELLGRVTVRSPDSQRVFSMKISVQRDCYQDDNGRWMDMVSFEDEEGIFGGPYSSTYMHDARFSSGVEHLSQDFEILDRKLYG